MSIVPITIETTARFKDFISLERYYLCTFWVKWIAGAIIFCLFVLFSLLVLFPFVGVLVQLQTPHLIWDGLTHYFATFFDDLGQKVLIAGFIYPIFLLWQLYGEWKRYQYETQRFTISVEGIRREATIQSFNVDYFAPWEEVLGFYQTPYHLLILENTQFFVLPKADFSTIDEMQATSDFICEQINRVAQATETLDSIGRSYDTSNL